MKSKRKQVEEPQERKKFMLNQIILLGRATKDPELRRSTNDTAIASFDIAVDNLGKEEGSSFFPVKVFGALGENVAKFVRKGHRVAVVGRIQQRTYMAKDGSKRSIYEVLADSVEFLESKPTEEKPVVEEPAK